MSSTLAPDRQPVATAQLQRAGALLALLGAAMVAVLHVVSPTASISPIRRTISEYGHTSAAWVFISGVLLLAIGSALILLALAGAGRLPVVGGMFGWLWVLGLTVLVIFPKHDWSVGPSLSGHIHRGATLVAFLSLPVAVMLLARRGGRLPSRPLFLTGAAGLAWFAVIVAAVLLYPANWWTVLPLGLVERGLALTEVIAVLWLGFRPLAADYRSVAGSGSSPGSATMVLP